MKTISSMSKPEFWFRPGHYWRRIWSPAPRAGTASQFRLPWGLSITLDVAENVGRQVYAFGLFELPVCEAISRLVDPGDRVADIGANLGHMTSLLAVSAGSTGSVDSFEPHPEVHRQLKANVDRWRGSPGVAPITLHSVALSNVSGTARLFDVGSEEGNCGLGSLLGSEVDQRTFEVQTLRLDDFCEGTSRFGVVKVDVEGAEALVFGGAEQLLREKRIRDIVYEDQTAFPSEPLRLLQQAGYTVFALGVNLTGPRLIPAGQGSAPLRPWDSPNYVATMDPERVLRRMRPLGWKCLRG